MIWMQFLIDNFEGMDSSKIESIKKALQEDSEVSNVKIDQKDSFVYLTSSLSSIAVMKKLNRLGLLANVHGQGSTRETLKQMEGAVGVFNTDEVEAIIRLVQIEDDKVFVDGSLIRLPKGKFNLAIHKFGDISRGAESCGEKLYDLGTFTEKEDTHQITCDFTVQGVIARSILLHDLEKGCIAYSVVARSSGVSQNVKKVCPCNPKSSE